MTDRELLELAARAAGIRGEWSERGQCIVISEVGMSWEYWRPLEDDGDALRLAVKLDIHLSLYGLQSGMNAWVIRDTAESFDEDYGDDPCASARRAIVRAAASIGKDMP